MKNPLGQVVRTHNAVWVAGSPEMTTDYYRTEGDFPEVVGIPLALELTGSNSAEVECLEYVLSRLAEFNVISQEDGTVVFNLSDGIAGSLAKVFSQGQLIESLEFDEDGNVSFSYFMQADDLINFRVCFENSDIDNSGVSDMKDFSVLAQSWLWQGYADCVIDADINCDGIVDMADLEVLAGNWLY